MAKKQFKAESKRLLDLMINSIYTHKEIFLREIISNSSDAIDKLCYQSLTDDSIKMERGDFNIRVTIDKLAGTVTVTDNGIGMTKEEMEQNLGTIAKSGSFKFKNELGEEAHNEDLDIIGQFGVGFYSAFMVADKVTVISRAWGSDTAFKWESTGADGYTVTEAVREGVGSDVIMHLKADTEDEKYSEYLNSWKLQELVKKYSDYVRWPIIMDVERYEQQPTGELDEKGEPKMEYKSVLKAETVNSMVPIWQRPKSEATDEKCMEFYKEKFYDADDPLSVIRVNAEGNVTYKAMLFIPAKAPYDFYTRDYKPGLQLYSSGVMIMDHCADLLPDYFRFVRGVVDSPDLSLNISREMLQHDRQLKLIANNIQKKVKAELKRMLEVDKENYVKFWHAFGTQIKYGIVADYGMKLEELKDLLVYEHSAADGLISLQEYAKMMPESQKYIYYAASESLAQAKSLPQAEQVRDAGFDIIYMTEDVDGFVVPMLDEIEGKKLCNVATDDLGLETDLEKADTDRKSEENKELLDFMKETLGEEVASVKLSHKLKTHPVCLSTEGEVTLEVEKYFSSIPLQNNAAPIKAKKVLEINGSHPMFEALCREYENNREQAANMTKILLAQAKLIAGLKIEDPAQYAELVCSLF